MWYLAIKLTIPGVESPIVMWLNLGLFPFILCSYQSLDLDCRQCGSDVYWPSYSNYYNSKYFI